MRRTPLYGRRPQVLPPENRLSRVAASCREQRIPLDRDFFSRRRTVRCRGQRPLVPAHPWRWPLSRHLARGAGEVSLRYLAQIAQAADDLGYFGVLLPTGRSCGEDNWIVASALAPLTERLRFLVAVRPGLLQPAWRRG